MGGNLAMAAVEAAAAAAVEAAMAAVVKMEAVAIGRGPSNGRGWGRGKLGVIVENMLSRKRR